jgi:hypothetical protein
MFYNFILHIFLYKHQMIYYLKIGQKNPNSASSIRRTERSNWEVQWQMEVLDSLF